MGAKENPPRDSVPCGRGPTGVLDEEYRRAPRPSTTSFPHCLRQFDVLYNTSCCLMAVYGYSPHFPGIHEKVAYMPAVTFAIGASRAGHVTDRAFRAASWRLLRPWAPTPRSCRVLAPRSPTSRQWRRRIKPYHSRVDRRANPWAALGDYLAVRDASVRSAAHARPS